jgi:hypothetical protein
MRTGCFVALTPHKGSEAQSILSSKRVEYGSTTLSATIHCIKCKERLDSPKVRRLICTFPNSLDSETGVIDSAKGQKVNAGGD